MAGRTRPDGRVRLHRSPARAAVLVLAALPLLAGCTGSRPAPAARSTAAPPAPSTLSSPDSPTATPPLGVNSTLTVTPASAAPGTVVRLDASPCYPNGTEGDRRGSYRPAGSDPDAPPAETFLVTQHGADATATFRIPPSRPGAAFIEILCGGTDENGHDDGNATAYVHVER